jgi:nucleotide-binding universal stress UspA family protein
MDPGPANTIVVGYDERPASGDALELARTLAEATGASLLLVTVLRYGSNYMGAEPFEQAAERDARRLFGPVLERLSEVPVRTAVL